MKASSATTANGSTALLLCTAVAEKEEAVDQQVRGSTSQWLHKAQMQAVSEGRETCLKSKNVTHPEK